MEQGLWKCTFLLGIVHFKVHNVQSEDWSPGDSTSVALRNSSREVGGVGVGQEGQYTCDFGEAEVRAIQHISFQNVSANLTKLLLITRSSCHHEGF